MKKPDPRIKATVAAIAFARDACVRLASPGPDPNADAIRSALLSFDESSLYHGFFAKFRWHGFTREGLLAVIRAIAENAPPAAPVDIHAAAKSEERFWREFSRDVAYEIRTGKPSKSNVGYYATKEMAS